MSNQIFYGIAAIAVLGGLSWAWKGLERLAYRERRYLRGLDRFGILAVVILYIQRFQQDEEASMAHLVHLAVNGLLEQSIREDLSDAMADVRRDFKNVEGHQFTKCLSAVWQILCGLAIVIREVAVSRILLRRRKQ
jgi:hypothetical protein